MTGEDIREAIKWSIIASVVIALWCGVLAVRQARASAPDKLEHVTTQKKINSEEIIPSQDLHPVWVIVVYEIKEMKLIGITEFVFPSYQDCQAGAKEAQRELGLHLNPRCFMRWMKPESDLVW